MNYTVLRGEISTDPLGRNYVAMSDVEVVSSLNTADRAIRQLVPLWQVKKTAIEEGCWLAIQAAVADESKSEQVRGAAAIAVDYINDQRFQNLDMDLTSTQQMLGALVVGGVITAAQSATLDALADGVISRAEEIGLAGVRVGDVQRART